MNCKSTIASTSRLTARPMAAFDALRARANDRGEGRTVRGGAYRHRALTRRNRAGPTHPPVRDDLRRGSNIFPRRRKVCANGPARPLLPCRGRVARRSRDVWGAEPEARRVSRSGNGTGTGGGSPARPLPARLRLRRTPLRRCPNSVRRSRGDPPHLPLQGRIIVARDPIRWKTSAAAGREACQSTGRRGGGARSGARSRLSTSRVAWIICVTLRWKRNEGRAPPPAREAGRRRGPGVSSW